MAVMLRSARQTTGDYYDFIAFPDGRLGIAIADVADKGMGAALFMASSRTLLRTFAMENADAPEKVLQATNQRITQDTHGGLFVTLFYGILNPDTGRLVYCNAGHNPPYLLDEQGETHSLAKTGIPLGIFEDTTWQTRSLSLQPGSVLVLYTDGVTEAAGPGESLYGEARLLSTIQQASPQQTAAQTLQSILSSVDSFRGKIPQSDDITLVVVHREV
jgi:serine phosphatase RsbU (regulator of sigma subunit)